MPAWASPRLCFGAAPGSVRMLVGLQVVVRVRVIMGPVITLMGMLMHVGIVLV